MKLSNLQKKYKDAICWLLDPDIRRSGRTTLMAYCFIKKAKNCPGRAINVWDHHPTYYAVDIMMRTIMAMIPKKEQDNWIVRKHTIMYEPK